MKPYYEHGGITIYHGDCRELLPMEGVDLILTDPPYGIAYSSNWTASWQGTEIANDSHTELRDWVVSVMNPTPMAIFGSWKIARPVGTRQVLIFDKGPAFGMGDLSFPWKNSFEEIYILGDGWCGSRDEAVIRGHIQVSWESKGRRHPNQKPESLIRYLLKKTTAPCILDPFMGSGTTLVAAKQMGRTAIGIELDERYCEIAANRLAQEVLDFKPEENRPAPACGQLF